MSGFYRLEGDVVFNGPNFVLNKEYELRAENKNSYTYPINGWYWFDTDEEAYGFFEVPLPVVPKKPLETVRNRRDRN